MIVAPVWITGLSWCRWTSVYAGAFLIEALDLTEMSCYKASSGTVVRVCRPSFNCSGRAPVVL